MTRADGIAETISDCLTERGIDVPDDVLQQLADDIDHGIQCWNETAYGHIRNPLEGELVREKGRTKSAMDAHDAAGARWGKEREEWAREVRTLRWKLEEAYRKGFRE